MKVLVLFCCVLVSYSVPCTARWEDGNAGVDRKGGDLPHMPIELKEGAIPSDCAKLCYANDQCKAWSYHNASCLRFSDHPECYLKDQVTDQIQSSCMVSAVHVN